MTTKLQVFLKEHDDIIKELAENFASYRDESNQLITYTVAKNNICNWLENFDSVGFQDFSLLLYLIKRIEFITTNQMQEAISTMVMRYVDSNTYIVPIGEKSESSFLISAFFNRQENFEYDISVLLDKFPDFEDKKIILVDDFLNSGGQIVTIFYSLLGIEIPEGEINDEGDFRAKLNEKQLLKLKQSEIHLFYYKAFDEGIEKIEERLNNVGLKLKIHRYTPANSNTGIFGDAKDLNCIENSLSGKVKADCAFKGYEYKELSQLYLLLKKVGKVLLKYNKPKWDDAKCERRALGYGNLNRLILTDYNVPTITITALWCGGNIWIDGKKSNWKPLFHRKEKILGEAFGNKGMGHNLNTNLWVLQEKINKSIIEKYLKANLRYDLQIFDELIQYHSEYFQHLINVKADSINFSLQSGENIFFRLVDYVVNSRNDYPLLVKGYAGCGKTAFLSILYTELHRQFRKGQIKEFPVLINLHKYNKAVYNISESFLDQAIAKLDVDIEDLYKVVEIDKNLQLIIIVDGTDEYIDLKVDLEDELFRRLSQLNVRSKIIGLRKHKDDGLRSFKKNKNIPFLKGQEVEIELIKKNVNQNDFHDFLFAFANSEKYTHDKTPKKIYEYLKETITRFSIEEVDLFLLTILLNGLRDSNFRDCNTLSSFFYCYCENRSLDIIKSAKVAFQIYNNPQLTALKDKNNADWWKIQRHESFRDYLVAYHIFLHLKEDRMAKRNVGIFNHVYPSGINKFCKEIINSRVDYQRACFDTIKSNFKQASITARTHFSYLLGRFEISTIKDGAVKFLKEELADIEKTFPDYLSGTSVEPISQSDKSFLLYHRTIYISLTYLGDRAAANRYLEQLLSNKYFDNLNRGFHLEYYGDIVFDSLSAASLKNEDNLGEFNNTYSKLYKRLHTKVNGKESYPMFLIELYTIVSLAQHRHVLGKLDNWRRLEIVDILTNTIKNYDKFGDNPGSRLHKYLIFIKSKFSSNVSLNVGGFVKDLYKLKSLKRSGWISERRPTRNIPNSETVASHTYGAYLLALFYLPVKKKSDSSYNKESIIKMLLIHDLAEAYMGDLLPEEKTAQKLEEEEMHFDNLSFLGTYDVIANVTDLSTTYHEFQHGLTINSKIAREIDKLDNLLQLMIYNEEFVDGILDFEEYKNDLIKNIETSEGLMIKDIIMNTFDKV